MYNMERYSPCMYTCYYTRLNAMYPFDLPFRIQEEDVFTEVFSAWLISGCTTGGTS